MRPAAPVIQRIGNSVFSSADTGRILGIRGRMSRSDTPRDSRRVTALRVRLRRRHPTSINRAFQS